MGMRQYGIREGRGSGLSFRLALQGTHTHCMGHFDSISFSCARCFSASSSRFRSSSRSSARSLACSVANVVANASRADAAWFPSRCDDYDDDVDDVVECVDLALAAPAERPAALCAVCAAAARRDA